jgi:hypothetical protein
VVGSSNYSAVQSAAAQSVRVSRYQPEALGQTAGGRGEARSTAT